MWYFPFKIKCFQQILGLRPACWPWAPSASSMAPGTRSTWRKRRTRGRQWPPPLWCSYCCTAASGCGPVLPRLTSFCCVFEASRCVSGGFPFVFMGRWGREGLDKRPRLGIRFQVQADDFHANSLTSAKAVELFLKKFGDLVEVPPTTPGPKWSSFAQEMAIFMGSHGFSRWFQRFESHLSPFEVAGR